jgi:arabinogalactan endo-1,4-beta-galactosidase
MWDCVEKLARRAHERGIDVLVDEDLTEFFAGRLKDRDFKVKSYPTYDARKHQRSMFDMFMEARRNKPWLWQEY